MPIASGAGRVLQSQVQDSDRVSMKSVNIETKPSTSSKENPFKKTGLVYPKNFTETTIWKKQGSLCCCKNVSSRFYLIAELND